MLVTLRLKYDPANSPSRVEKTLRGGQPTRAQSGHVEKIKRVLARLDRASKPEHLDLPGWRIGGSFSALRAAKSLTWIISIITEGARHEYEASSSSRIIGAARLP
jgi:hypothetical protein